MKSKHLLIHLDYCLTPTHRINNAAIVIEEGKIWALGGFSAFTLLEKYDIIDMPGCYAMPGFVDTRLYGAGGYDIMHADTNAGISAMTQILAQHGVTSFLPTTLSAPREKLLAVIESLARMCNAKLPGAEPVGIHIEGPYISQEKRGTHRSKHIRRIDLEEVEAMLRAGAGKIKVFTFAPELEGAVKLTELLCSHGVMPAMGHTVAYHDEVMAVINAGALRCSHLYNGMAPIQQRKVGLAALAMTSEKLWVELIPDGIHIHPGMINLACRCIPKDRIVCISNSIEAAGLTEGTYKLGDDSIQVTHGRSILSDGTIAGSVNFLDENFRTFISFAQMSPEEAASCFSLNPARSIGCFDRGELKPGKRADITILDAEHKVQMTLIRGEIAYCHRNYTATIDALKTRRSKLANTKAEAVLEQEPVTEPAEAS